MRNGTLKSILSSDVEHPDRLKGVYDYLRGASVPFAGAYLMNTMANTQVNYSQLLFLACSLPTIGLVAMNRYRSVIKRLSDVKIAPPKDGSLYTTFGRVEGKVCQEIPDAKGKAMDAASSIVSIGLYMVLIGMFFF